MPDSTQVRRSYHCVVQVLSSQLSPYTGYEFTKRRLEKQTSGPFGPGSMLTYVTAGATGGICYWLACYPLDVVKSKVQLAARPPSPGGLGYIGREMAEIVRQGGV
jgi:solute carrier family 25 carnitine/acylcarnitine transporter 20/29